MTTSRRTTLRKPAPPSSIQTFQSVTLGMVAQHVFDIAQQKAFQQGISDHDNSTRDHPPYGFSDLKQAWQAGWLAASQRANGKRKCAG